MRKIRLTNTKNSYKIKVEIIPLRAENKEKDTAL